MKKGLLGQSHAACESNRWRDWPCRGSKCSWGLRKEAEPASCSRKAPGASCLCRLRGIREVLEAQPAWPLVEGAIRTLQPVGNQVVLAEPRRVLPIADKNVSDGAGALRKDRVATRISGCKLRDVAEADAVVVATGQESGPRR